MSSAGDAAPDEAAILSHFQALRGEVDALWSKITELDLERQEHALVLETLTPLDAGRRCFRLVGGVLVERTVGEVSPAVARNREALEEVRAEAAAASAAARQHALHAARPARCGVRRRRCSFPCTLSPNPRLTDARGCLLPARRSSLANWAHSWTPRSASWRLSRRSSRSACAAATCVDVCTMRLHVRWTRCADLRRFRTM